MGQPEQLRISISFMSAAPRIWKKSFALAAYQPYPRGAPQGLPFRWDMETLKAGLNFTLTTKLGWIDLFGEIAGGGTYDDLIESSPNIEIFGQQVRLLNLEALIRAKKAAGRPKDYETLAKLESIKDRRSGK
jgi:hypothetical protein